MGRNLIMVLLLAAVHAASGWTNGQLLIWMRASAMQLVANQFENDFGIPVRIETPEKITQNFPLAVQAGKGPDIAIWAHDKVGEWADGGVIAPVEVTAAYKQQFYSDNLGRRAPSEAALGIRDQSRSHRPDLQQKTSERRTPH
jgi:maltose-binding protein MalE